MQNVVIGDSLFVFKMHAKMHLMVVKVILCLQFLLGIQTAFTYFNETLMPMAGNPGE